MGQVEEGLLAKRLFTKVREPEKPQGTEGMQTGSSWAGGTRKLVEMPIPTQWEGWEPKFHVSLGPLRVDTL